MSFPPREYTCTLSPDLIDKAEKELNEKASWRSRDIQALREMVLAHKGLKTRTDDGFLLRFLRARKFDYERSYQLLLNYHRLRMEHSAILQEITPRALSVFLDYNLNMVLPHRTSDGCRIIMFRPGRWDPQKMPLNDMTRLIMLQLEKVIQEEETQVNGVIVVSDFTDFGLVHAKKFNRDYARMQSSLLQNSFPVRIKAIHIINEPAIFSTVFAIIKTFLKSKMISRIHFHGDDLKSLHSKVMPTLLPSELGGFLGPATDIATAWRKELDADQEIYEEIMQFHMDLGNDIIERSSAGAQAVDCLTGTYKKLNVE